VSVAVLIAAKDAGATIARAIRSALAEPEVSQVIVVDDGSSDDTTGVARGEDDRSGRLLVERFSVNQGPSAARNHALALATAAHIAILDADDVIVRGRFARLLATPEWDMVADNILFVPDGTDLDTLVLPRAGGGSRVVDTAAFIDGCVARGSRTRSQLGFLKPVIRRRLLTDAGLHYDERVRLGEDFILYVDLLRRGARFVVIDDVGYVAVERGNSLSARHATGDLAALLAAERKIFAALTHGSPAARAMRARLGDTHAKYALRAFLQTKRDAGLIAGLAWLARRPDHWRSVIGGIARDKLHDAQARRRPMAAPPSPRLLLTAGEVADAR
jgi:succinoglycan biosynthesis protein ExoU